MSLLRWCRVCFEEEGCHEDAEMLCDACADDVASCGEHELPCACGPCLVREDARQTLQEVGGASVDSLWEVRRAREEGVEEERAGDSREATTLARWLRANRPPRRWRR